MCWSQQDEQTIEELIAMSNSLVSFVINRQGRHACRYDGRSPVRTRATLPVVVILDPPPNELCARWAAELAEKVSVDHAIGAAVLLPALA